MKSENFNVLRVASDGPGTTLEQNLHARRIHSNCMPPAPPPCRPSRPDLREGVGNDAAAGSGSDCMDRTVVGGCNSNINVDGHYHGPIGSFFYGLARTADATTVVSPAHPPSLTSRSAAHAAISQKKSPSKGGKEGQSVVLRSAEDLAETASGCALLAGD